MFQLRSCVSYSLCYVQVNQRRTMMGLFEEQAPPGSGENKVSTFARSLDQLEAKNTRIVKKACGIPFHIGEAEALDAVCRHHGATVRVHSVERYMMPFWLAATAAGGSFRAEILQRDPAYLTQQHCLVWVEGPNYQFSYPFGEHHPSNQVSASYVHPLSLVERCVVGTHVPSMLISRFELLKELEEMEVHPKIIPFAMSTATALTILDSRLTRDTVLRRIDQELVKFHGSFVRSNVTLTGIYKESISIRPVFLPMLRFTVTTGNSSTQCPTFVCGATGKVAGPVLHLTKRGKSGVALLFSAVTLIASATVVEPGVATTASIFAAALSLRVQQFLMAMCFLREQTNQMAELKTAGMLHFTSDQQGYRWSPEDEEREEYEYREELRRQARKKESFEQRVKEEAARDEARRGRHVNPKERRRTDLENVDPLGYYKLLGLSGREFSATSKDVAVAFREAARRHHPDVSNTGENDEISRSRMQKIILAYKILRDPITKKAYDSGKLTSIQYDEGG
ncbi:chaperone protein DNAj, putative [Trypanosoma brucei gambiense DAL972]|uniref:Chaperone protein DNAj, putative n=1 Tax=Trypanosoma brucei gambiense (strain MHOM/CI/86/DAL972) TaxID=679716 RepID=C9ZT74_TRYB9|nr:chaperone protein DNAj, putative [Trypanosoma brucei gambiense DAL972]CBH12609.1 chaperone protein DNAj, putative [Trypanosoma brucei gambiense DAL972]|eukprot:XP_011774889.1 chaperone protein DNAj, putative [Trypanosoma brucei gambiense DAL972]